MTEAEEDFASSSSHDLRASSSPSTGDTDPLPLKHLDETATLRGVLHEFAKMEVKQRREQQSESLESDTVWFGQMQEVMRKIKTIQARGLTSDLDQTTNYIVEKFILENGQTLKNVAENGGVLGPFSPEIDFKKFEILFASPTVQPFVELLTTSRNLMDNKRIGKFWITFEKAKNLSGDETSFGLSH